MKILLNTDHPTKEPEATSMRIVGKRVPRPDAYDKVRGSARYIDDLAFSGMLFCKVLRSPHPHARIRSIDIQKARAMAGVHAVLTAQDIPGENVIPIVQRDMPMLARHEVNFVSEGVALIAAESAELATRAAKLVRIEYEPLTPCLSIEESLKAGRQNIIARWKIRRGDVKKAFANAAIIIENTYRTPYQEHAYLEPNGMIAVPDAGKSITVYGSLQCPFYVRSAVSTVLGLEMNQVRVVQTVTGGGFGGKEDMPSVPAAMAALLAWKTGRPVKYILSREEDILSMSKRHPGLIKYKTAVAADGTLLGVDIELYYDSGAYTTLSPVVLFRGIVHAAGPYRCENVKVNGYAVRTHKNPCGAFRGFGEPQVTFAHESQMDCIAEKLGMDPLEIRMKNLLELGNETITGHKLTESVGMKKVLSRVIEKADWHNKRKKYAKTEGPIRKGIGLGTVYYGVGLGAMGKHLNPAGANVVVNGDGSVQVAVGTTEMGQGMITVLSQIAAEELGCDIEQVRILAPDTSMVPDSGPTVASRTTIKSGNAIRDACQKIRAVMDQVVPLKDGKSFAERASQCVQNQIHLAAQGWAVSPTLIYNSETGQGEAYIVYSWCANIAEVEVDMRTGEVKVIRIVSGHDVGRVINPTTAEGQIEGGVVQAIGYALVEEHVLEKGRILNDQFSTYIIPSSLDIPEIVPIFVEELYSYGPYGAKGLGETPMLGVAPAIANAVAHATGIRLTELPMTPERVWQALSSKQ